jgi:hypothetical protein
MRTGVGGRPFAAVSLVLAIIMIAGCGAGVAATPRAGPAPAPGLTARMVLIGSHTIPAGASAGGALVLDNTGHAGVKVTQGCGGAPQFAVVLTNSRVQHSAILTTQACPPIVVGPGPHRFPFVLRASYEGCTAGPGPGFPKCLQPGNLPVPLPVGTYRATMGTASSVPIAPPLAVTVIGPRPNPGAFRDPPVATPELVPVLHRLQQAAQAEVVANQHSGVHHGYIVITSRERAAAPDLVNSDQPVYQLVLRGHFQCLGCSVPPGHPIPRGTVITLAVDQQTLQPLDFGIGNSLPMVLAGDQTYRFTF